MLTAIEAPTSVAWLSRRVALVVAGGLPADGHEVQAWLVGGGQAVALETKVLSYGNSGSANDGSSSGSLLLVRAADAARDAATAERLSIRAGQVHAEMCLREVATDLKSLLRGSLAALEPQTRASVIRFLGSALDWDLSSDERRRLCANLLAAREALRDRLPYPGGRAAARGLQIDALLAVDSSTYYVRGRLYDHEGPITSLTAIAPEGGRTELLDRVFLDLPPFAHTRDDAQGAAAHVSAFIGCFDSTVPSLLTDGWRVAMVNAAGIGVEAKAPPLVTEPRMVTRSILASLSAGREAAPALIEGQMLPAVTRLQARIRGAAAVERITQYGIPPQTASMTVIVVLGQRAAALEHQLGQFVHDPHIARADLIYIVDPADARKELDAAGQLFELYRVPFRLICCRSGGSFATAVDSGVSLARAPLLLLLEPEALPDRPGSFDRLAERYRSMPDAGAIGPKLLQADDSIRHCGFDVHRSTGDGYRQVPRLRGCPRTLPAANVSREVQALSAACLMIGRDRWQQLGGLRGVYLQPEAEAVDLCLRLIDAGYHNWCCPDVEVYHLDADPPREGRRPPEVIYDEWLQSHLWSISK